MPNPFPQFDVVYSMMYYISTHTKAHFHSLFLNFCYHLNIGIILNISILFKLFLKICQSNVHKCKHVITTQLKCVKQLKKRLE